jgi:hypothetical protein
LASITAKAIVAAVRVTLVDPDGVRWTSEELLGWLNDAQREIAILRPDSSVSVAAIPLTSLSTLQTLPASCQRLVKITRNMGTDGLTPGLPITLADHGELDRCKPDWHSSSPADSIRHYTYDGKSPRSFYAYPRPSTPPGTGTPTRKVEAHMQVAPTDATMVGVNGGTSDSVISVDDIYSTAIHDYIVHRAKMKATDAFDAEASEASYQRFLNRLGLKLRADKSSDPHAPKSNPPATTTTSPEARDGGAF